MGKLLVVARHEYLRFARRKSFLFAVLGLPLVLVAIMGVGALAALGGSEGVVGYVDRAGILDPAALEAPYAEGVADAEFRAFPDEDAGRQALAEGGLDVLFLVPEDYLETRALTAVEPAGGDYDQTLGTAFGGFIELSLASRAGPEAAPRLVEGSDILVRQPGEEQAVSGAEALLNVILPFGAGFLFIMAAISSAGYLLQAISDEKENRTVEILATSVSPFQLIVGKTVGLIGVAATQLGVWALGLVAVFLVGSRFLDPLASLEVPWALLGVVVAFFVPAYLLLAGIMVSIGSAFPEYRQSQQVVAVINVFFFAPYFFVTFLLSDPDGPLAVALTLFPTTSFLTISLRWAATTVPVWQLAAAWLILAATTAAVVWTAPRIFRAGMLRYGQRLDLRASLQALRTGGR